MKSFSQTVDNHISKFSLNYLKNEDQYAYGHETKYRTLNFINLGLLFFLLFFILCLWESTFEAETYQKITTTICLPLLYFVLYIIANRFLIKRKVFLEVFFGLLTLVEMMLLFNIVVPQIISALKKPIDEDYEWVLIYFGMNLETLLFILYLASMKWYWVSLINLVTNWVLFKEVLNFHIKNSNATYAVILLSIQSIFWPIILSYSQEISLRKVFISLKKSEENLLSFQNLIDNIIPNEILILNCEKFELLYYNTRAKTLFINESLVFKKLIQIKINNSDQTLIDLYKSFIISQEKAKINEFITCIGCISSEPKANFDSMELGDGLLEFDIKIGLINWQNKKAILISFNDISSTKTIINLTEINRNKDIILATVSHDLRSPLNNILGIFTILNEKVTDQTSLKCIISGIQSVKILSFMINDILDFSRIKMNKLKLNLEAISLGNVLADILSIIEFQAAEKVLRFELEIEKVFEKRKIYADPLRLKQILLNLLGNAIKFTSKGFIKLEISQNSEKKALFKVIDSGIGIQKHEMINLFNLYYKIDQEDSSINRNGIGLGLAISQNLAKMMDSNGITVESVFGQGSIFHFELPAIYEEEASACSESDIDAGDEFERNLVDWKPKMKDFILLVDDDPLNILIYKKYMESFELGYDVAYNGLEAMHLIEKYARNQVFFSAIILDYHMPMMDGVKTAERINKLIGSRVIPYLPIILVSGNEDGVEMKGDFKRVMKKPVMKEELKENLRRILNINIK